MHLLRLRIERLRAIEQFEASFADATGEPRRRVVLLGANGAGKTTILDAIVHVFDELCRHSSFDRGARRLDAGDVRKRSRTLEEAVSWEPSEIGFIGVECALLAEEQRRAATNYFFPRGDRSSIASLSQGKLALEIGRYGRGEFIQPESERPTLLQEDLRSLADGPGAPERSKALEDAEKSEIEARFRPPKVIPRLTFDDFVRNGFSVDSAPCVLFPARRGALDHDAALPLSAITEFHPITHCLSRDPHRFATLASRLALATLEGSRTPLGKRVQRLWKVLEKYFPELPHLADASGLKLSFETADRAAVPLSALSDGERAILLLCGEIALRSPEDGVILIDEIEQHLHPKWQRAILEAIPSLVPSAQLIVTTQSPYVAACAPDDVIEIGDWKAHGE